MSTNIGKIGLSTILEAALSQPIPYIIDDSLFLPDKRLSKRELSRIVKKSTPRTGPKIGRNDLCTCGSNKKYKNCCLKH